MKKIIQSKKNKKDEARNKAIEEFKGFLNPKLNLDEVLETGKGLYVALKPLIDEVLTSIANGRDQCPFSNELWANLHSECISAQQFLSRLRKFTKSEEVGSELSYNCKKVWTDLTSKLQILYKYQDGQESIKPIHLIFSFINDSQEINKLIIENKLNVNDKDKNGLTAIHYAAKYGNKEGLELLINEYKVDVNYKASDGTTIVHYLAGNGHVEVFREILNYGVDVNAQSDTGCTASHLAIDFQWSEFLTVLAQIDKIDFTLAANKYEPLYIAASNGNIDSFKLLVNHFQEKQNFDVNKLDGLGHGLLHYAMLGRNHQVTDYLISELHADPSIDSTELIGTNNSSSCIVN